MLLRLDGPWVLLTAIGTVPRGPPGALANNLSNRPAEAGRPDEAGREIGRRPNSRSARPMPKPPVSGMPLRVSCPGRSSTTSTRSERRSSRRGTTIVLWSRRRLRLSARRAVRRGRPPAPSSGCTVWIAERSFAHDIHGRTNHRGVHAVHVRGKPEWSARSLSSRAQQSACDHASDAGVHSAPLHEGRCRVRYGRRR